MGSKADNFYPGTSIPLTGADVIKRIQQETDTVMCLFSCGKVSIGAFQTLRQHFTRVVPVYRDFVPGLKFVDRRIAYYEDVLDTHIVRINSTHFYRLMHNFLWQPPHRVGTIQVMNLPVIELPELNQVVKMALKMPDHSWIALGIRAADSSQRRATCLSRGGINWKEKSFWPIWDMRNEELEQMLIAQNIKLPTDYLTWGTSFDSIRWFFLKDIRDRYPEDYATILEWFPLIELEFMRRELVGGTIEEDKQ
jgi:hypothetical protein